MTPPTRSTAARPAVVAAGAGLVLLALLPGSSGSRGHLLLLAAQAAAVLALLLAGRREAGVWRWWAAALAVVAAGPLLLAVLHAADGSLPGLAVVAATPLVYGALVRWNRFRTYVSDPGDWLNGLSAVCALTAAVLAAQRWLGFLPAGWSSGREQVWALVVSSLVILLGTAATVAGIGGLARDVRVWLVLAVLGGLIALKLGLRGDPADGLRAHLG